MGDIQMALILMCYGLGGVFATLILFFFLIKLLTKVLPYREKKADL